MAEHAIFTVLQRSGSLALEETKYLLGVPDKLESAKKQLVSMQAFLMDLDEKMLRGGAMARNLVSDVWEVAQEMEDIIDIVNILWRQRAQKTSFKGAISKYACLPLHLFHLHKVGKRIDSAAAKIKTIFENFSSHHIVASAIAEEKRGLDFTTDDDTIQNWRSIHPDLGKHVHVIGFDDKINEIKWDLLDKWNVHLSIFSIVGPGGAGKSTMANKVYGLPEVNGHFKICAWITVSQRFVARDLLKEMVKRTMGGGHAEELDKKNQSEVKKMLHDFLCSRRYLIVLDDIWGIDAWDMMSEAFPDDKNGSRVILTTRNEAVANHPYARKKIYTPKLLNEKESTQLLLRAALPEYILDGRSNNPATGGCNLDDLKKVGEDLAKKCCGLPLALVVLGGHLSRNLDIAEWRRLTSSVDWHALINTDSVIGAILDLSYYDMPCYLRSCFMYTTAFPEDSHIDVQLLSNLWIAEGFIPVVRGRTRVEVAIRYVTELVQRCIIQVAERAPSGRITVIKVHDVLRDWGIGRARKEGLIKDCHGAEDIETDYTDEMTKAYRMVLHGFLEREVVTSVRKLRTLLDFTLSSVNNRVQVSKMFDALHHMRVLYLHGSAEYLYLPESIGHMRYLKYIGLGGSCCYHLPCSIGELLSLETLDSSRGKINDIPNSLWKIPTLRHVLISLVRYWSVPPISSQSNVHVTVCHSADFSYTHGSIARYKRLMEATKRKFSEKKMPNLSYCFGLKYVTSHRFDQMEIVGRCKGENQFRNDLGAFGDFEGIRVLKMSCTNLFSNEQRLVELMWMRNLQVLEIGEQSYTGSVITCPRDTFHSLLRLVLHDLAVTKWNIEDGSMTNLMDLTLCKCPNLLYLPEGLSLLPRLMKLKLIEMPAGCHQETVVAMELKNKGCRISVSSEERDFEHLDIPVPDDFSRIPLNTPENMEAYPFAAYLSYLEGITPQHSLKLIDTSDSDNDTDSAIQSIPLKRAHAGARASLCNC